MKRFTTLFAVLALIVLTTSGAFAQSMSNYAFAATAGTYTAITGSTDLIAADATVNDDGYSAVVPLGWNFVMNGVKYSHFIANVNGFMRLGQNASVSGSNPTTLSSVFTNAIGNAANTQLIAPMFDDLYKLGNTNDKVHYTITGGVGTHILTVEWKDIKRNGSGGVAQNFQAQLIEATSQVVFVYGTCAAPTGTSASVGFTDNVGGTAHFVSITDPSAAPKNLTTSATASTTVAQDAIDGTATVSGLTYTFTPPFTSPAAPTTITFTSVGRTGLTLGWTDNSTTEAAFTVSRATALVGPYSVVAQVPSTSIGGTGTAYSVVQTGLSASTTYFYNIAAVDEGSVSADLSGSTTTAAGPVAPFSGAYTINPNTPGVGTNFNSFGEAFSFLNLLGVSGPTTFTVSGTAATVTFAEVNLTLGGTYISGVPQSALLTTLSATNTLTFVNDAGKTINISGAGVGTADYAIRLMGVDYVTFNGINVVDTTVATAQTRRYEFGYVIQNSLNDGAINNTIKNFSVTLIKAADNAAQLTYGVAVGNGTTLLTSFGVTGTYASRNNNNKIQNFTVSGARRGVVFNGLAIPSNDEGNEVSGPAFTSAAGGVWVGGSRVTSFGGSSSGTDYGVGLDGQKDMKVFNVQVDSCTGFGVTTATVGIHVGFNANGTAGAQNVEIYNNVIRNISNNVSLSSGVTGIRSTGAVLTLLKIYNNLIYDLRAPLANAANVVAGMNLNGPSVGSKLEIYNNSISLTSSAAIASIWKGINAFGTAGVVFVVKNNAFNITGGDSSRIYEFAASSPNLLDFSNNVMNVGATVARRRMVATWGATTASNSRTTLLDWQSTQATPSDGVDQRSAYGDPGFASATDLTYGGANRVNNVGVPIAGLSTANDILGVPRSGSTPDAGAFEGDFSAGFVDAATAGIAITPLEGSVSSEVRVVITDNVTPNVTARLWYRLASTAPAGAYGVFGPDLAPSDSGNGVYRWGTSLRTLAAGTYQYYIVVRDAAGNSYADPTMTPSAVSPGFTAAGDPNWNGANPFLSAGVRTFQNIGAVLAAGTYAVGPTGIYPTLTAVAAEVNTKPLSGSVIFELQPTYTGAGEATQIVFNQPSYTVAGPLTITIRPDATVAAMLLTAGNPGAQNSFVVLDGARDVIFDGRPGGLGSTSFWTIRNSKDSAAVNNAGEAVRLQNDALRNTFRYMTLQANATTGLGGVINIGATFYGGQGNNLNTIDNCDIGPNTAAVTQVPPNPLRGIGATGGGTNVFNRNNTYSNNRIHDFHSLTGNPIGIFLAGEVGSTITGNSIYQTVPRTGVTLGSIGIAVNPSTGPGNTITNNYIGGSAALCGGSPYTLTTTSSFTGISFSGVQFTTKTTMNGNTIANFNVSTSQVTVNGTGFAAISVAGTNQVPMDIKYNVIGNSSVNAVTSPSIAVNVTGTANTFVFGYIAGSSPFCNIVGNTVGGFRLLQTSTGTCLFAGIQHQTTDVSNLDSNLVGSLATSRNIWQGTNAQFVGISHSAGAVNASISYNTIANILDSAVVAGTSQIMFGLSGSGASPLRIVGNTVRDIIGNNHATVRGLSMSNSGIGNVIRGNSFFNFTINPQTPATGVTVEGIFISSSASTGSVDKNLIYSLVNGSTSTSSGLYGIDNQFGANWTYSNNMISLGSGSAGDIVVRGIYDFSSPALTGFANFYYNSIYISGAVPAGSSMTAAYYNSDGSGVGLKTYRNNIFANTRTGAAGLSRGFAFVASSGTTPNMSSNNNLFYTANDTVAQWLGTASANNRTLAGWQAVQPGGSGGDAATKTGDPAFTSLTDLHVNTAATPASVAANIGAAVAGITTDIDGATRNVSTPDAGYDEFTLPAPAAFTLTSPANGALGQPLSVSLNWSASAQFATYDLYIGVGSLPGSPTVTGLTSTSYIFAAAPTSTYFWNVVAKNADASTSSTNGAFTFSTISPPTAPSGLTATATGPVPPPMAIRIQQVIDKSEAGFFNSKADYLAAMDEARGITPGQLKLESSVSGINLSWTDNAASGGNSEDSFYVYRKLNSAPAVGGHASPDFLAAVDSSLGSGGTVLYTNGPLGLNEAWYYKVTAKNAQGESGFSGANTTTLVNTPGAPTFSDVSWNRMKIYVDIAGNPGTTETYAIRNTQSGQYVSATGTISSVTEVWQTYAAWGGVAGKLLTGLARGTAYTFEVKARNSANVETAFGTSASQATTFDQPISQLAEDFTSVAFPPAGWTLQDEGTLRWLRLTTAVQKNGIVGPAAQYNFYDATATEVDTLVTPAVSLTGALAASINWDHAYRTFATENDSIFIMISSDAGATWTTLLSDGNPNMATLPPNTTRFVPTAASNWRSNTIDIPGIYLAGSVQIAWRAKSNFGNQYWLDNITLLKKVSPDNITVTMNLDADGLFATSGDRSPKVWHLALRTGSPTGPVVSEADVASLSVPNLLDGTYYAVASDSGAGWAHIGRVRNATPVAGKSRIDTITVTGGGVSWITDFVVASDLAAPTIAYALVGSTSTPGSPVLTATIKDNLGLDVSAGGKPRMWYRSGSSIPLGGAYTAVSGVAVDDTTYNFTFPALSSVTFVEYYVAAQDNALNVITEPAGTGYTTNPPNGVVASGNRFLVASPLTFTVGTAGANFPSITEGLTWFNGGIDGPMQFLLNSDYTSAGETFPITIAGIPGMGARPNAGPSVKTGRGNILLAESEGIPSLDGKKDFSKLHYDASKVRRIPGLGLANRSLGTNHFTIKPNTAATPGDISGSVLAPNGSLIILDGASGVTIQGLTIKNSGDEGALWITGGSSNNRIVGCTLKSNATFDGFSAGTITIADFGAPPGSNNNAIVNCNVSGNGGPNFSAIGIYSGDGVTLQDADTISGCTITGFGNTSPSGFSVGISILDGASNLVIENNDISTPIPVPGGAAGFVFGIAFSGLTGPANVNCIIRNNVIHDIDATGITTGLIGGIIIAQASTGALVEGNTIRDIGATTVATNGAAATRGISLTVATGTTVSRNVIKDLQNASPASIVTAVRHVGAGSSTFVNNVIVLGNVGLSTTPYRGIQDAAAAGIDTTRVLFNSVYIGGVATSGTSDASVRTGASNSVLRNNIFMNERDGGAGFHYGIRSTPASGGTYNSDYNAVYVTGATNGVFGAFAGVNRATLALWQTASAGDANSKDTDPLFVDPSSADLHIKNGIGDLSPTANAGIAYGGVTVDIDNETGKRTTTPDIGADEFNLRAPVAFSQLTPANGAINVPVAGSLTWDGMPLGATAFDVYLNSSATATTLLAGNITASTTPYSGLLPDSTYVWSVVAKNSDSSTTATGAPFNFATILSTVNVNVSIAAGWNMISNPVIVTNDSVRVLYPTSSFTFAYSFSAGYVQDYTMENGTGYWEKFPGALSQTVSGLPNTRDTVDVVVGWNMVGSVSNSVDTSTIVSIPSGIRASNWYGYIAGYVPVANLLSGQAYWIRSNAVGKFVLANPLVARPAKVQPSSTMQSVDDVLNTLTITDSRGGSQTLYFGADGANSVPVTMYTMPPMPPVGAFDARFETSDGGSMVQTHALQVADVLELPVSIQSEAYPLTITWNVNKGIASYELTDGRGGSVFHAKEMRGEGSMKITNSSVSKFAIKLVGDGSLPKEFSLSQNYPNPFNPTTNIKFALPVLSRVEAEIYNVLGQRVSTLVKEELAAGYHAMEWNGTSSTGQQVGSGTYFLRLSATGANGKVFTEVRKLLMLK